MQWIRIHIFSRRKQGFFFVEFVAARFMSIFLGHGIFKSLKRLSASTQLLTDHARNVLHGNFLLAHHFQWDARQDSSSFHSSHGSRASCVTATMKDSAKSSLHLSTLLDCATNALIESFLSISHCQWDESKDTSSLHLSHSSWASCVTATMKDCPSVKSPSVDTVGLCKVKFLPRLFDRATNAMWDDAMHTCHCQWDASSHSYSLD
jgi:hypothetical protein